MQAAHPFHFPFVVKQVGEFLTVSVPDFEIAVGDRLSHNPKIDNAYVALLASLITKAAKLVATKMEQIEAAGKTHFRPASYVRQSIQTQNSDQWSSVSAARYLGISVATLKRWELKGIVRAEKSAGGHRKFIQAELERVKSQMKQGQRPETQLSPIPDDLRSVLEKVAQGLDPLVR